MRTTIFVESGATSAKHVANRSIAVQREANPGMARHSKAEQSRAQQVKRSHKEARDGEAQPGTAKLSQEYHVIDYQSNSKQSIT